MVNKSRQLTEIKINIANIGYKIDNNNLLGVLKPIYRKMSIEKKLFTLIEKNQKGDNL